MVATLVVLPFGAASAAEYWFGTVDPVVQRDRHVSDPADYVDLFGPDISRWATVVSKLPVFEISTQLVLRGQNGELPAVLGALKWLHVRLSGQFGVLVEAAADRHCGAHLEGMGTPLAAKRVAKTLSEAGGTLDYLDMDEPVVHGHLSRQNLCPQSIPDMADVAAGKVAIYRRYFPNMHVGLIEPVNSRVPDLARDVLAFIDELRRRDVIVEAFTADVAWDSDWRPRFEQLATGLPARRIRVSLFRFCNISATSDVMWTDAAIHNCQMAAGDPQMASDNFFIATWSPYPKRVLPESRAGSLTAEAKQVMALFR